jgi:hypothetical protein
MALKEYRFVGRAEVVRVYGIAYIRSTMLSNPYSIAPIPFSFLVIIN